MLAIAVVALLTAAPAWPQSEGPLPSIAFRQATFDAGEVYPFATLEHGFEFTNAGDRAIRIHGVQSSDPNATIEPDTGAFQPGDTGTLNIRQPVGARLGKNSFRFTVLTDDEVRPNQELVLEVFVQSAYDVELPFLDFGDIDRAQGKTLPLEVSSREVDIMSLAEVVRAPEFMNVSRDPEASGGGQSLALNVSIPPAAPVGLHAGVLHLRTDIPHHPDYLIRYQASVFGDVAPEKNPTEIGIVRQGQALSHEFRLGSRSGSAFRVGTVRDTRGWLKTSARPCAGGRGAADCWIVTAEQTAVRLGRLDGALEIQVGDEIVPVAYTGLVVAKDATIRSLGTIDEDPVRVEHAAEQEDTP